VRTSTSGAGAKVAAFFRSPRDRFEVQPKYVVMCCRGSGICAHNRRIISIASSSIRIAPVWGYGGVRTRTRPSASSCIASSAIGARVS
jgi:hypothetical protein